MKDIHTETGKRLLLETFADHNAARVALRDHTSTGRVPKILARGAVRRTIDQLNPFEDWSTPTMLEGSERAFTLASLRQLSVDEDSWFGDQAALMLLEAKLSESDADVSVPGKRAGELAVQGALW